MTTLKTFFQYSTFVLLCAFALGMISTSQASAQVINDGDLVRADQDVYIIKIVGSKTFKRLIVNPQVFDSYGHLRWDNIKTVSQATLNRYTTSNLVRQFQGDGMVYRLFPQGDTGVKSHIQLTAQQFQQAGGDWDSIYEVNQFELALYTTIKPTTTVFQFRDGMRPDMLLGEAPSTTAVTRTTTVTRITQYPTTAIGYVQKLEGEIDSSHPDYNRLVQALKSSYSWFEIRNAYIRYLGDPEFATHRSTYLCDEFTPTVCNKLAQYLASEFSKLTDQEFAVVFDQFQVLDDVASVADLEPNTPIVRILRGVWDIILNDIQFINTICDNQEFCVAFLAALRTTSSTLTDQEYLGFFTALVSNNWAEAFKVNPSLIQIWRPIFTDFLSEEICTDLEVTTDSLEYSLCIRLVEKIKSLSDQEFLEFLTNPEQAITGFVLEVWSDYISTTPY